MGRKQELAGLVGAESLQALAATLEGTRQQPSLTITEAERTAEYLPVKPIRCWGRPGARVSKATPTANHHKQIWRKEAGQLEGQTTRRVAAFVAAK